MNTFLANYITERQTFHNLLRADCHERILLYRGESGSGKTTLLKHCAEKIPKGMPFVPIQMRQSAVNIAEIFSRAGLWLTWERLTNFTTQIAAFEGNPHVLIDRNWLAGINNRISVIINVENQSDRESRRVTLTEALFEDFKSLEEPVIFLFDSYEQASTEAKEWISGPFLSRTAHISTIRVVVAGQEIPDQNNIEWGHCATSHDLYGVIDEHHWMPVVQQMKKLLPNQPGDVWLAGICHALKGKPSEIKKVIEALPSMPEARL